MADAKHKDTSATKLTTTQVAEVSHVKTANTSMESSIAAASASSTQGNPKAAYILRAVGGSFAVRQDRVELITRFLDVGGDVNAKLPISSLVPPGSASASKISEAAEQLCPLIHLAALAGLSETFQKLLSRGAETTWRDNVGWTLLHACASGGSVAATKLCLESAIKEVDIGDSDNDTPLHVAAFAGRDAVARLLLDHGADTTCTDGDNCTPLHCACRSGIWSLVEKLLDVRADPGAVDGHGGTPMAYAVLSHADGLEDIGLQLLRKAGARVSDSAVTVATRQLTSKPGCARCINVDKELKRMREEDMLRDAEAAAADAAAVLLEEEQKLLEEERKRKEEEQRKKEAAKLKQNQKRIKKNSDHSSSTASTTGTPLACSKKSPVDPSPQLSAVDAQTTPEVGPSESASPALAASESAATWEENFSPSLSRSGSAERIFNWADECDSDHESSTDPVSQESAETAKTVLAAVIRRSLTKTTFPIDTDAFDDATGEQMTGSKGKINKPKASTACRRANLELLDDCDKEKERKRQKRARQKERKVETKLVQKINAADRQDVIASQKLRADAPEFCPMGLSTELSDIQESITDYDLSQGRLLPSYVENIAWSYENLGEDMCNAAEMDAQQMCYYIIDPLTNTGGYCQEWDDSDSDDDGGSTRSGSSGSADRGDINLAQILVHTVVSRVLTKSASSSELNTEARPLSICSDKAAITGMFRSGTGALLATGGVPGVYIHSPVAIKPDISDVADSPDCRPSTPEHFPEWQNPDLGPKDTFLLDDPLAGMIVNFPVRRHGFELMVDTDGNERRMALPL